MGSHARHDTPAANAGSAGRAVMVLTIVPDEPRAERGTGAPQWAAERCTFSTKPMAASVATNEEPP